MAEIPPAEPEVAPKPPPKPTKPPNPVFRMLGLPNFRLKLPSRNWLIFLSITGGFTSTLIYDRRQKKLAQQKWCRVVEHIAHETMPTNQLPRKITVFLAAPPGDTLRPAREYFREFVRPVLVAGAMDWEVIEGRREGDVRAKLAERIRDRRRRSGEAPLLEDESDDMVRALQTRAGTVEFPGMAGDLVIGRHAWKEYIRGLHEGWLGPLDPPPEHPEAQLLSSSTPELLTDSQTQIQTPPPSTETTTPNDKMSLTPPTDTTSIPEDKKEGDKQNEPPKPKWPPPPYILATSYSFSQLPPSIPPNDFDPSLPLPFPHLLGFLNTPVRIYRFLNKRRLADSTGREVASIVLAASSRPYRILDPSEIPPSTPTPSTSDTEADADNPTTTTTTPAQPYEQSHVLHTEEPSWHKSIYKPLPETDAHRERVWLNPVILDPRIADRMRRFEFPSEEKERVEQIEKEGRERGTGAWDGLSMSLGLKREKEVHGWETVGDVSEEDI
ncbi:MAG: mitochondrial import inner membrane translocase subunit tim54 [Cirrosporium novae-zelandiae]|nr:MAG: mitochondrial import inner membrane translocase subunit tim54 [Cirrosporium novae-zelandiae]